VLSQSLPRYSKTDLNFWFLSMDLGLVIFSGNCSYQGELFEVLEDDKCLPEDQVQAIAKQLVCTSLFVLCSSRAIAVQNHFCRLHGFVTSHAG
jgi:hypothetical protein